ncbi:hypothetical protein BC938DRAFT_477444 [Jimgerdemannia flammicorona]|uniref:Mechanosensitive ion channel MscS domain-containing protein n=1 Tax=Jimgerdemannia flammicorona TaxID=994334 RepID=A0A433P9S7_9FUNG|nr:hypothetical protein BC938DRAFT_477444 [Jimgerdemannia flammicorona]
MPIDRNQFKSGDRVQFKISTLPGTPTGEITGTVSKDPLKYIIKDADGQTHIVPLENILQKV